MSKGSDMLAKAAATIVERGAVYGDPKTNMEETAALWAVILGIDVTPQQVAACMIAVKLSRLIRTPNHEDSVLDIAGYAAVLRDCQEGN